MYENLKNTLLHNDDSEETDFLLDVLGIESVEDFCPRAFSKAMANNYLIAKFFKKE